MLVPLYLVAGLNSTAAVALSNRCVFVRAYVRPAQTLGFSQGQGGPTYMCSSATTCPAHQAN